MKVEDMYFRNVYHVYHEDNFMMTEKLNMYIFCLCLATNPFSLLEGHVVLVRTLEELFIHLIIHSLLDVVFITYISIEKVDVLGLISYMYVVYVYLCYVNINNLQSPE